MRHPKVGDVRGKGLLWGIELVKDRKTKEQLDGPHFQGVVDACRKEGVIVGRNGGARGAGTTICLSPPLVITRGECDRVVETLDRAIAAIPG
jgi:4-aminobutyrate aminotransferase-like enzyme